MSKIVYGARCAWWDSIEKAMTKHSGLPCCPHCGGVLFEMEEDKWNHNINDYVNKTNDTQYKDLMNWMQGKCFRSFEEAKETFKKEQYVKTH